MALDFPSPPYDGQIHVDPTSGSKYIYEAATTKWKSIQHIPVTTVYGFDKANAAFYTANAAYDAANNVGPQIAPTYNTANAAFAVANAALPNVSNAVFNGNLRVTGNLLIGTNTVTIRDNHIISAEYYRMNTDSHMVAIPDGNRVNTIFNIINVSFDTANAAYTSANNVGPQIAPAFNTANAGYATTNATFLVANLAFNQANSIYLAQNADYVTSNAAYATANAAFGAANNVGPQIAPAFNTANAAFGKANTALQNTNGTLAGSLTITGDLSVATNSHISNLTVVGTMNVSSGINASATSPYIFNKPTPSGYQTTLLAGSAAGGLYITSDNAIIGKGCYYNNGWIATATSGNFLDFASGGTLSYSYFTGATVGNAPSLTSVDLVHTGNFGNSKTSAGYTRLPNGVILQWGSQSVGGDREVDYSFPLAFPSGCYGFAASGDWWGINGWMATGGRPISASVYRLYNIVEGTLGVWWVAVGY